MGQVHRGDEPRSPAAWGAQHHRNLLVLERMAERYGRAVVLRTPRRWAARLVAALNLAHVRVEPATRS